MWRVVAGSIAWLGLMVSCVPDIPSSEALHSTIVLTKVAPNTTFNAFRTFFIRPDIQELGSSGVVGTVDSSDANALVKETSKQLTDRGFHQADSQSQADMGVELAYLASVNSGTTCYSWYDPYYWGYPGYSYYPYYGDCTTTTWKSNTLVTVISDLLSAKTASNKLALLGDAGSIVGGDSGIPLFTDSGRRADSGNGSKRLAGIWFSGIYGVSFEAGNSSLQDGLIGIDQAFAQSPYIATAR